MSGDVRNNLERLYTNFSVEKTVLSDNEKTSEDVEKRLVEINALLDKILNIVHVLEDDGANMLDINIALEEAQRVIESCGLEKRKELQSWCDKTIRNRFDQAKTIPHFQRVFETKPIAVDVINTPDRRLSIAEQMGFRFDGFDTVLGEVGFWERVGPAAESDGLLGEEKRDWKNFKLSIDDSLFPVLINILNGGANLDYEGLFPEARDFFFLLKTKKFHESEDAAQNSAYQSSLSVPDILLSLTIKRLSLGLPPERVGEIFQLNAGILNDKITNDERIRMYQDLDYLCEINPLDKSGKNFAMLVEKAADDLSLPKGHVGRLDSLESMELSGEEIDIVVVLNHFDDGRCGYLAREIIQKFPRAFIIPSGMHSPHEMKTVGDAFAKDTEADEMVASLLIDKYPDYFNNIPDMPKLPDYTAVNPYDILVPEQQSTDTATNAQFVQRRVKALSDVRDHKSLSVVIVTTDFHSARAYANFRSVFSEDLVPKLRVYEYKDSPQISNIAAGRKAAAILDVFCEYIKRLYLIATQK